MPVKEVCGVVLKMCHILLSMPVLALAMFWFWPVTVALPVYLVVLVLSVWLYVLTLRAMHAPAKLGREGMLHESGRVIGGDGEGLRVRVHNEIWSAEAGESLQEGERVRVVGLNGLTLKVQRLDPASGARAGPVHDG
jgi:membrane protein implicated in regulation of membrane protease activity